MKSFSDRLISAIDRKQNPSVIGLDSDLAKIPACLRESSKGSHSDGFEASSGCILEFNKEVIESIKDIVPAVKIQSAFYEQYGPSGCRAFIETARYARERGLIVIGDVKRNDIGNTSKAYSGAYLGKVPLIGYESPGYDLDAITVNPYLGTDGIRPFVEDCRKYGKGIFVLVKTSNPSSSELQDIGPRGGKVFEAVAGIVNRLGDGLIGGNGYSPVGAVVGATQENQSAALRKIMPKSIFLVPGFGAQGGSPYDVVPLFNKDGRGAVIHAARSVIFAYQDTGKDEDFQESARASAERMRDGILKAMKESGKCPW